MVQIELFVVDEDAVALVVVVDDAVALVVVANPISRFVHVVCRPKVLIP